MKDDPGIPHDPSSPHAPSSPVEVDTRGLRCPMPVIRLAEAARTAPRGTVMILLATDPAVRHDVPAWCRMRDHELREITEASDPDAGAAQPAYLRLVVVL